MLPLSIYVTQVRSYHAELINIHYFVKKKTNNNFRARNGAEKYQYNKSSIFHISPVRNGMNYATMQLGSIAKHFEALSLGTNGRWKRLMVAFNPGIKIISRAHRSLRGFWLIGTITTDGLGRAGFVESAGKHRQSCCFGPGCDNFMNCMWMWRYARTGRVNGGQKLCTGCSGGEKRNKRGFQGSDVRFQPSVPVPGSRNWATSEGASVPFLMRRD